MEIEYTITVEGTKDRQYIGTLEKAISLASAYAQVQLIEKDESFSRVVVVDPESKVVYNRVHQYYPNND